MVSAYALLRNIKTKIARRSEIKGSLISFLVLLGLSFSATPSAFAAGGTCPSGNNTIDPQGNPISISNVGITGTTSGSIASCYFVSKSTGSDSNTGTDEGHPWAHMPGMASCSSNCSSHSVAPGDGYILRGGDTWTSSDLPITWLISGTSSHPIYIGVDQSWFNSSCGSSWCRPIFNASGINASFVFNFVNQNWVIADNIEVKGMTNQVNGIQNTSGSNIRATQLYFHAWTHSGNSNNVGFFSQCGSGSMIDHNVMDGSDSTKNTMNGVFSFCAGTIQYNYFNYMVSGILATFDNANNNLVENAVTSADGDHCNGIFNFGPESGSTVIAYNNVERGMQCSGGVNFWLVGNSGGCNGCQSFAYNNIIDASAASGNVFNIGGHPSDGNTGTYTVYNNTVIANNGGSCFGNGESSPRSTTNFANNQCIGTSTICDGTGTTCNNLGNNLLQSISAANGQGYSPNESQEYSPPNGCTSATCSSVQSGKNLTSSCSGNLAGLCNSVSYPTYNSTKHTMGVTPAVPRPASGAWDIGAYEFASTLASAPNPPSGLAAVVQ